MSMIKDKRSKTIHPIFVQPRIWTVIAVLSLTLISTLNAFAQKELHIESILNDPKYYKTRPSSVTRIKGKNLKPYHQTFFHSVKVSGWSNEARRIAKAVQADEKYAVESETVREKEDYAAYYMEFSPKEPNGTKRYVLFQCKKSDAILIYMEGRVKFKKLLAEYGNSNLLDKNIFETLVPKRNKREKPSK